ncbi:DNA polymerase [Peribacillus frigoritolerans]|uniref:DNA polymerase I n=1 Tax=Peribacillus castrilensis TaxID=2897690 RepID=A0AAW9NMU9_9BACI|nr:DNA polymerase [Peribacillus castrilensis]
MKFDCHIMRHWMDIKIIPYLDTMLAAKLLDENTSAALKDLAPYYLKVEADKFSTLFGKITFDQIPIKMDPVTRTGNLSGYYAIKDTELTFKLAGFFMRNLNHPRLEKIKKLLFDVEMPFLQIVVDAEAHGVRLDIDYLEKVVAKQLNEEIEILRKKIENHVGKINLNSPAQLSEALYVKLKLPRVNKKSPNSTDAKTLKKLKKEHEIIGYLLDYRGKVKLVTSFAEKLPKNAVKGRVHSSFQTIGTKTGRLSCNNPNLQQVPARVGGLIRNAFIADEGRLLASIDFSGQELRVLAHISQDPVLLDIYLNDGDVHSMTAVGMYNRSVKTMIKGLEARIYDLENGKDAHATATMRNELTEKIKQLETQVVDYKYFEYCRQLTGKFQDEDGNIVDARFDDEELLAKLRVEGIISHFDIKTLKHEAALGIKFEKTRKSAKTVNFGIIYGMSELGLADTLEISEDEAKEYILGYFDAYPGVKAWMASMRRQIDEKHYAETMLGRKRRVYPEMTSGEWWLVQRAYRMGINSIIQGSSADMTKLASIALQPLLEELDVRIVLWVHDEIIFDIPENIGNENLKRMADIMCNALPLSCGLKSDIEVGAKWGQRLSEDELDFLMEDVA